MPAPAIETHSRSQALRRKMSLFGVALQADHDRFWCAPDVAGRYPFLLREVYSISRMAPGSQMEKVGQFALSLPDEASQRVGAYLLHHAEEERGHWEWILDDLAVLGVVDRKKEEQRPPSVHATAVVGCGYVWAMNYHPAAYLGYMSMFEGHPYTVEFLEEQILKTGLPREAFRYYLDHARLDQMHAAEIHGLLDDLSLPPEAEQAITLCALQTQTLLHELLKSILEPPLGILNLRIA